MKSPTKTDLQNILSAYNLGTFISIIKTIKNDQVSLAQIINTTKGKIFLKIFREFTTANKQGLEVMHQLRQKNFPVFSVHKTKKGKLYTKYKGMPLAFFEYVKIKEHMEWIPLNKSKISEYAKYLAKFHKLTKNMKLKSVDAGNFTNIRALIKKYYKKRTMYSPRYRAVLAYLNNEIDGLKCPKKEYSTGYFSEFNPGHVIFSGNKLKWVLDWEIGHDNAFYDFGSSMVACFSLNEKNFSYDKCLSYEKLKEYIKSYDKVRKLSKWEKDHIYEALKFGCFKYGIWEFADIETGGMMKEKDIDLRGIRRVEFFMSLGRKEKFLKELKNAR
jgi:hypothetical protein